MLSEEVLARPSLASILEGVLEHAKEIPTNTRSVIAITTWLGITRWTSRAGANVCLITMWLVFTEVVSHFIASTLPSVAHLKKLDGRCVVRLFGAVLSTTLGGPTWVKQAPMHSSQASSVPKLIQFLQSIRHLIVALFVVIEVQSQEI